MGGGLWLWTSALGLPALKKTPSPLLPAPWLFPQHRQCQFCPRLSTIKDGTNLHSHADAPTPSPFPSHLCCEDVSPPLPILKQEHLHPPWSFDSIFYVLLTFSTHTIHTSNILPTDRGCVMEEVEAVTDAETGTGFLPVLFPSASHCCSTWLHRPLMSAAAYQWFPYMHAGGAPVHLFGITCILLGSVIFPPWVKIKLVSFF